MRYLVTGGAGFIGTNLVIELIRNGHAVIVLDNYAGGKKPERLQKEATYIEGDIRDAAMLDKVLPGIDGIFHLAALPRVVFSVEHPWETHDVNVNGTLQVLMAAVRHGIKKLVFSSSSSTYGGVDEKPFKEDSVIKKPLSPYALHKFIGEQYCRLFSDLFGIATVSLIYFNVYGPYFDPEGAYALVIGKFLKLMKEGKPLTVRGDGMMYRDYTHVSDVVRANVLAMENTRVGKGETFNIGCGTPHSVMDLVTLLGAPHVFVPSLPGEPRYAAADNAAAKKILGWAPTIQLEEGIAHLRREWGL